jgi:hypothetical protein
MPEPNFESLNYDWMDYADRPPQERFPDWVIGYFLWREYLFRLESLGGFETFRQAIEQQRGFLRPRGALPGQGTRIFISHKQENRDEALRVGWIVNQLGHPFWLDVLNPQLAGASHSPCQIAAIIEMALLNCTHVIALITPQSDTSRWIPYEYGRVKEPSPYSLRAASWVHPKTTTKLPEYLELGVITRNRSEIESWLGKGFCGVAWNGPEPPGPP